MTTDIQMRAFFQKLLGEMSFTAMNYIIKEQCLPVAPQGSKERELFVRMYNTSDLDERHLICAEYLGYKQHAQALRDWIVEKKSRGA